MVSIGISGGGGKFILQTQTQGNPTEVETVTTVMLMINALACSTVPGSKVAIAVSRDIMKSNYNRWVAAHEDKSHRYS